MFLDNEKKRKQLSKWIIGIIAACILIFLSIRYISSIAAAVSWVADLTRPLWVGVILALVLNVPLSVIEKRLFQKHPTPRRVKARRALAIFLALVLVLGILVGVVILVIPELVNAVVLVVSSVMEIVDQLALMESSADFETLPFGEYLARIDIDWLQLRESIAAWVRDIGTSAMDAVAGVLGNIVSSVVDGAIGLVFSIYILANKEKLKRQMMRLIRAWLPRKVGDGIIHVASVCRNSFRLFIVGQTTEAVILGTLCVIGMLILRLPYAPMIGALVGVLALIPYVGAWIAAIVGVFMIMTESPFQALVFIIFLLALQQVEGNLIYPRVVGAKINLPAMWVLAAITAGGNLAGPIGMLLGVPIASSAYALLKEATENREKKLASEAQLEPEPHQQTDTQPCTERTGDT